MFLCELNADLTLPDSICSRVALYLAIPAFFSPQFSTRSVDLVSSRSCSPFNAAGLEAVKNIVLVLLPRCIAF